MQWCRLYQDFLNDPKIQTMNFENQRHFVCLLLLHIDNEIEKLSDEEIAFTLRISSEKLTEIKTLFIKKGLINQQFKLTNWSKRQYKSDISTERVKRHREAKKKSPGNSETDMKRFITVTETPPDTETDNATTTNNNINNIYNNNINNNSVVNLDTKANKISTRLNRNSEYLRELESWFPSMNLTNSRIFAMLKRWDEADVERIDIQTALECKKAGKHTITSPLYFEFVVVDFAESRRKGLRKPVQYETLDEKNERGIREAIARIEKRERGEIT